MGKSIDELQASKAGATGESNGFGSQERPQKPAGLYRHPDSGAELITKWHPIFGSAQADGAVRVGFKFVRDATPEELREKFEEMIPKVPTAADNSEELKGIYARLSELETTNTALTEENDALKATPATPPLKEQTKEDK